MNPRSVAVFGGEWADEVVRQLRRSDYQGEVWRVHPRARSVEGAAVFTAIDELPHAPDAAFVAVRADLAVGTIGQLSEIGCGGAVCFAAGFDELDETGKRTRALLDAAGPMPVLGPNCYGFLNYLDGVVLWPDQQPVRPVDRGVAIISQSGNLAINMTLQARGLPIGSVWTVGNQAMLGVEELLDSVLDDERVSAVGLYLEGVRDRERFLKVAHKARRKRIPVVVIKAGATGSSQATAMSHTASLAGDDAVFSAFCARFGWARVGSVAQLVETLKLLHVHGPLSGKRVASMSCSGGEAALVADLGEPLGIEFAPFDGLLEQKLFSVLGPKVTLANPLDYQTYIWGDTQAMAEVYGAVANGPYDAAILLLDFPNPDEFDLRHWWPAVDALEQAAAQAKVPICVVANLPESAPQALRERLLAAGVAPLQGLETGLQALVDAANVGQVWREVELPTRPSVPPITDIPEQNELAVKRWLGRFDVQIPVGECVRADAEAILDCAERIGWPVVLKTAKPLAHKSDVGGVHLGIRSLVDIEMALPALQALDEFALVEAQLPETVVEILVGVQRDAVFGPALTIAPGGTLVELLGLSETVLLPCTTADIERALDALPVGRLLAGYRGKPAGSRAATVRAIAGIARAALSLGDRFESLEVNPLAVAPLERGAWVLDAVLSLRQASYSQSLLSSANSNNTT